MLSTEQPITRTLTLVLPESDWRALREVEPDAVAWLQSQIRHRLGSSGSDDSRPGAAPAATSFMDDDY